ncbi:ArnT family glycosyltransferase [Tunturiibacter psychrotolerans]|uniref:ArnT family glycosyltransferase n=1 Tax=Tunturiibacter psychrotolerans TaxID=3069686 RepID=UPI003D1F8D64
MIQTHRRIIQRGAMVASLLLVLFLQLLGVNIRSSMSWDEGHHLFDGYTILKHRDFGLNPEVPPLAKAAGALPLLSLSLYEPEQQGRSSQLEAFLDGKEFLFKNDANGLLLRGRLVISLFTVGLALLVFLAGQETFGATAGLLALAFLVFDPTLLAHGALVTTDATITFLVFAAVYAWYRYMLRPAVWRLLLTGVVMGLAWAAKFTGLFLVPTLGLMVLVGWFEGRSLRLAWKRGVGLAIAVCVAFAVLWSCYGFRYAARPDGMVQNPTLENYLQDYAHVANPKPLQMLARTHVLPEAYIWGLANTKLTEERDISYLFGTLRRHGTWLYFPAAILIKSTLPFLVLLVVAVVVCLREPAVRSRWLLFLAPVVVFLGLAMRSDMNIGVRHILPIYPFLYLVGASALSVLISRDRRWIAVAGVLFIFQVVTSLRSFPGYIAYANEAWGGQRNVHRLLSDSNSDWGQQLKTAADYLRERHVTECWMAYTASGVADERYYGVPCKPLPTMVNLWWIPVPMNVPAEVDGPVLISDDELEGVDLPFGQPNPYAQFKALKPTAILDGGLLVYDGHFDMHAASSLVDMARPKKLGTKQESVQ